MLIKYHQANIAQQDKTILSNVDFHIETGEFVYIIGKVGSGKSSLLKTMYCELDMDPKQCEQAEVLGRNLLNMKRKDVPALRREMGIIFQDFQLLHDRTVAENLHFVLHATGWKKKEERNQRIDEVLADVEMTEYKTKMPHELSGGEQQRIAIARALLNNPKIIIADEPTGNLDPETARNIVSLLYRATQTGTAVIMSTHNISLIDSFPGIVYQCRDNQLKDITAQYTNLPAIEDNND